MSRLADEDFRLLLEFISNYSLALPLSDDAYREAIKKAHKRYLALLTVWASLLVELEAGSRPTFSTGHVMSEDTAQFLERLISDVTESFACAVNGIYKGAYSLLRSSIENYVRAFGSLSDASLGGLTSIYELFDVAFNQSFFLMSPGDKCLNIMRSDYSQLCGYVHSGTDSRAEPVHALAYFPTYDVDALNSWVAVYCRVVKMFLVSLVQSEPKIFFRADFRGQDLLSEILPSDCLRALHMRHE